MQQQVFTRREFLIKSGMVIAAGLATGCEVFNQNTTNSPNLPGEIIIPPPGETSPIKEGEGPPGTLAFSTDPAKKFGDHNVEYHPELIEQHSLSLSNTDGTKSKQYPVSVISKPVWSTDGNILAVHSYGRDNQGEYGMLVFVDKDGQLVTRTDTPLSPAEFSWAPHGESIFYTSRFFRVRTLDETPPVSDMKQMMNPDAPPNWITGIYRYDFQENRHIFLMRGLSSELIHCPSVSPDGTKVAYVKHKNGNNAAISIIDANGGNTKINEAKNFRVVDTETCLLTNASTRIQWTPDGKRILYMMEPGNMDAGGDVKFSDGNILHIVDVTNSSNPVDRIKLPGPSYVKMPGFQFSDKTGNHETTANWRVLDNLDLSPDGERIAFGSPGKITVMDLKGKNQMTLMLPKSLTEIPDDVRWLGDGRIGFTDIGSYYVLNVTSHKVEQVTFSKKSTVNEGVRFAISSG